MSQHQRFGSGGGAGAGSASASASTSGRPLSSGTLFLDVMQDAQRWSKGPPQTVLGSPERARRAAAGPPPSPPRIGHMLATQGPLGIERKLPDYDVHVIGVEQLHEDKAFLGIRGTYISYVIKTMRLKDGASSVVSKRYRSLRSFSNDLLARGMVEKANCPIFPKKDLGVHNATGDDFVRQRQAELQSFLKRLFAQNPGLWSAPSVRAFFSLDGMTLGTQYKEMVMAQRQQAQDQQEQEALADESNLHPSGLGAVMSNIGTFIKGIGGKAEQEGGHDADASNDEEDVPEPHPEMVRRICEMGFPETMVRMALKAAKNDPNLASEYLMNGVPHQAAGGGGHHSQEAAQQTTTSVPSTTAASAQPWRGWGYTPQSSTVPPPPPQPPAPTSPDLLGLRSMGSPQATGRTGGDLFGTPGIGSQHLTPLRPLSYGSSATYGSGLRGLQPTHMSALTAGPPQEQEVNGLHPGSPRQYGNSATGSGGPGCVDV